MHLQKTEDADTVMHVPAHEPFATGVYLGV